MLGCYIIHSATLNKFYIGATQDGFENRLLKHNEKVYGNSHFTATANDWVLYLFIAVETYKQAIGIERHIKKMKSSTYIKNLKQYPEMMQKLKTKFA